MYPAWWTLIQVEGIDGRHEFANIGALLACPDLKYIDCMLSPDGSPQDLRVMAFLHLSQNALRQKKDGVQQMVAELRQKYLDNPHPDIEERRKFVLARLDHRFSYHGSRGYQFVPMMGMEVSDSPSVDLERTYRLQVEWLPASVLQPKSLPLEELAEVLDAIACGDPLVRPHRLFVGGSVDAQNQRLLLLRADGRYVSCPFSAFPPSGNGIRPDFGTFEIIDYGQTIKLGEYEASAAAVLRNSVEVPLNG